MEDSFFEQLSPLFTILEQKTDISKDRFRAAYMHNNLSADQESPCTSSLIILLHFAEAFQNTQNKYPAAVYLPLLGIVFGRDFHNTASLLEYYQQCVYKFAVLSQEAPRRAVGVSSPQR